MPKKTIKYLSLIDCSGFPKDHQAEETAHAIPFLQVKAVFPQYHPYAEKLQDNIDDILTFERDQDKAAQEGGETNEILEDMFITFHDPIAAARDVSNVLAPKITNFKALTEAIQTGETIKQVKTRLFKGETAPKIDPEYASAFTLALSSYNMIYSNPDFIEQFDGGAPGRNGNDWHALYDGPKTKVSLNASHYKPVVSTGEYIGLGADYTKIANILGISQREALRTDVLNYREDLGLLLKSPYFQDVLQHYINNSDEHCLTGVADVFEIILPAFNNPYNIDRHLLLKTDYRDDDLLTQWLIDGLDEECETATNAMFELLNKELSITDKLLSKWIDLSNKFGAALYARLEIHTYIAYKTKVEIDAFKRKRYKKVTPARQEYILKKVNKVKLKTKGTLLHIENETDIIADIKKLGLEHDDNLKGHYQGKKTYVQRLVASKVDYEKLTRAEAKRLGGKHKITIDVAESTPINKAEFKQNAYIEGKYNPKVAKFLNSRGFTGALTALQVLNFRAAIMDVTFDNFHDFSKTGLNFIGISAELTEAGTRLQAAHLRAIGKAADAKKLVFRTQVAGAIGGAITTGMCFWDGYISLGKGDDDAALAWGFAGLAFGVATLASLGYIAALTGPVGWIALGIGFGLVVLANIFTDSKPEYFFKNYLLCDRVAFEALPEDTPMSYTKRLIKNKSDLVVKNDREVGQKLTHPADAIAHLHDITVCTQITYKVAHKFAQKLSGRSTTYFINKFSISMVFNQFLEYPEQLEALGFLIHAEDQNTDTFELKITKAKVDTLDSGQTQLSAQLGIPKHKERQIGFSTYLVIALRLHINSGLHHSFPYPMQYAKIRYLGARFKLSRNIASVNSESESEFKYEPISVLKQPRTW